MGETKRVIVVNSSWNPKRGAQIPWAECEMLRRGCVAAWTAYKGEEELRRTFRGHRVLLYSNGRGVIASGIAQGTLRALEPGHRDRIACGIRDSGLTDLSPDSVEHQVPIEWRFVVPPEKNGSPMNTNGITCFVPIRPREVREVQEAETYVQREGELPSEEAKSFRFLTTDVPAKYVTSYDSRESRHARTVPKRVDSSEVIAGSQGVPQDPVRRRVTERYGVAEAIKFLKLRGYDLIEDRSDLRDSAGVRYPYDLLVRKGRDERSIEVKASTSPSVDRVRLTAAEVLHAHQKSESGDFARGHDLIVVQGIRTVLSKDGEWRASGGEVRYFPNHRPTPDDLTPSAYWCRL